MEKLNSAWEWIKAASRSVAMAHEYLVAAVETFPTIALWIGVALAVCIFVF